MNQSPLCLGKISRRIETELGFSFPGDHGLYVSNEFLDELARRKPEGYLSYLEGVGEIIGSPDFVAFDEEKETLTYYSLYYENGFMSVGARFVPFGLPRAWHLTFVKRNPPVDGKIVRIKTKRKTAKKKK